MAEPVVLGAVNNEKTAGLMVAKTRRRRVIVVKCSQRGLSVKLVQRCRRRPKEVVPSVELPEMDVGNCESLK